jgi:hypothetical protein
MPRWLQSTKTFVNKPLPLLALAGKGNFLPNKNEFFGKKELKKKEG